MQRVQGGRVSTGQGADSLIVVVADRTASEAGQEEGKNENEGIARDQHQEKADDGKLPASSFCRFTVSYFFEVLLFPLMIRL